MEENITLIIVSETTFRIPLSECNSDRIPRTPEELAKKKEEVKKIFTDAVTDALEPDHILITDVKYYENFDNPPKEEN